MNRATLVQVLSPEGALIPPVASLQHLGRNGWDVHLLCERVDTDGLDGISALPAHVALRHLHPTTAALRADRRPETSRLLRRVMRQLARHPLSVSRGLRLYGFPTPAWVSDRYVDALLLALQPRLVHLHLSAAHTQRRALLRLLGAGVIVTVREADLPPVGTDGSSSWREVLAIADGFCFPDESVRERAIARGLAAERPWMVGTSVSDRGASGSSADRLRLLSLGDLSWRQGYEHALHAVRLLLDRGVDCEYRLVGDGEHAGALRFARSQLRLDGHVELVDPGERGAVFGHLRWADVFLHPAVADEPLDLVAQAAEVGLPIVATVDAVPGAKDDQVLPIQRRDPRAIADAVTRLAQGVLSPIRPHDQPAPSLEECLGRLEDLYQTVLEGLFRPPRT